MSAPSALPADVIGALRRGEKLDAIKLLREATGLGLKEAKDIVEATLERQAAPQKTQLASGAVPRSKPITWLVAGLVIAVLLLGYFLRGSE